MRFPFGSTAQETTWRKPVPTKLPELPAVEVAALYRAARIGGDFYDFLQANDSKLLFLLMDIAGKRDAALHIAAHAQDLFRERGRALWNAPDAEDAGAVTTLLLEMNRAIIAASNGVCCAPAFLGCYDSDISTVTYINAGHTSGILKDEDGTLLLEANGLPLGLFSHATHECQFCALRPGAALVLVSKGLVENRTNGQEFGLGRVQQAIGEVSFSSAAEAGEMVLEAVRRYEDQPSRFGPNLNFAGLGTHEPNDVTTLVLMRKRAAAAVPA